MSKLIKGPSFTPHSPSPSRLIPCTYRDGIIFFFFLLGLGDDFGIPSRTSIKVSRSWRIRFHTRSSLCAIHTRHYRYCIAIERHTAHTSVCFFLASFPGMFSLADHCQGERATLLDSLPHHFGSRWIFVPLLFFSSFPFSSCCCCMRIYSVAYT